MSRRQATSMAAPDRAAGLTLTPVISPPPAPAVADPPAAAKPDPAPGTEPSERKPAARKPARKTDDGPASTLSVYIPADLRDRVNTHRAGTGESHETWFTVGLRAVDTKVRAHYGPRPKDSGSYPPPMHRTRRVNPGHLAQYSLRLSPAWRKAVEDLRTAVGSPTRSDLVTTIVRLRLEQLDTKAGQQ